MKELLTIIQAVQRAREALSLQHEHRANVVLTVLADILENDEVTCALEKLHGSLGSPPLAPDVAAPAERRTDPAIREFAR